jgi:hypothetical protein
MRGRSKSKVEGSKPRSRFRPSRFRPRRTRVREHRRRLRSGLVTKVREHTRRIAGPLKRIYRRPTEAEVDTVAAEKAADRAEMGGRGPPRFPRFPPPVRPEALGGPREVGGFKIEFKGKGEGEPRGERIETAAGGEGKAAALPFHIIEEEPPPEDLNLEDIIESPVYIGLSREGEGPLRFVWFIELYSDDRKLFEAEGEAETVREFDRQMDALADYLGEKYGPVFISESSFHFDTERVEELFYELQGYPDIPVSRYLKNRPGYLRGFAAILYIDRVVGGGAGVRVKVKGEIVNRDSGAVVASFEKEVSDPEDIRSIREDFEEKARREYGIKEVEIGWGEGTEDLRRTLMRPPPKGLEPLRPREKAPELGRERSRGEYVRKTKELIKTNLEEATEEDIKARIAFLEERIDYLRMRGAEKEADELEEYLRALEKIKKEEFKLTREEEEGRREKYHARILVDVSPENPEQYRLRLKMSDGAITSMDAKPDDNLELEKMLVRFKERIEERQRHVDVEIPEVEWTPRASARYDKEERLMGERERPPEVKRERDWILRNK